MSMHPATDDTMAKSYLLHNAAALLYQSSEMYGGINGFWDYGPVGVPLRRAVEQLWWRYMVEERDNVEGLDSTIICHPEVWNASGHLAQFSDSMTDCLACKKRTALTSSKTLVSAQAAAPSK